MREERVLKKKNFKHSQQISTWSKKKRKQKMEKKEEKQSKRSITNCQIDVVNKALKIEEGEIEIFANRTVGFSRM